MAFSCVLRAEGFSKEPSAPMHDQLLVAPSAVDSVNQNAPYTEKTADYVAHHRFVVVFFQNDAAEGKNRTRRLGAMLNLIKLNFYAYI